MTPRRLLLPVDALPPARLHIAELSFDVVLAWAERLGAEIVLFSAIPAVGGVRGETLQILLDVRRRQASTAHEALEAMRAKAEAHGVKCTVHCTGDVDDVGKAILDAVALTRSDLVVIPARARKSLIHHSIGSVAISVLRASDTPVLILPTRRELGLLTARADDKKSWLMELLSARDDELVPA